MPHIRAQRSSQPNQPGKVQKNTEGTANSATREGGGGGGTQRGYRLTLQAAKTKAVHSAKLRFSPNEENIIANRQILKLAKLQT